jgi:hypothetical protein
LSPFDPQVHDFAGDVPLLCAFEDGELLVEDHEA